MPAAALRGLAKSGSPASSRSRFVRSKVARGRNTSPRTSIRPAGASLQAQRKRADGADVRRDLFAARAVAAGRPAHQHAVLVGQGDAQAVDLQLGDVRDRRVAQPGALSHALVEGAQLLLVVGVVEAEHRRQVLDRGEALGRAARHPLGRRVGRDEIRVLRLERLELVQQAVELLVGNLGVVLDVVALFVVPDRAAQLVDALLRRDADRSREAVVALW